MASRTPLYNTSVALGAQIVEFAGYDMPILYSSIRTEHEAVRQRAGLFDVSHMGEFKVTGPGAGQFLQRIITNDLSKMADGQSLYTVMCNENAGIIDDLIVNRVAADDFLVVVNASRRTSDWDWMHAHASGDMDLKDVSDETALLALQGPVALEIMQSLPSCPRDLHELSSFHFVTTALDGIGNVIISRTGYTGEDGFEIFVEADCAVALWEVLMSHGKAAGLLPCGLGARDTLRLEAGLRLYGQDMDESTDPFSCGLAWTVKMGKGDFIGRAALQAMDPANPKRRFIGLETDARTIPRHEDAVLANGKTAGKVTSGTFSFTLGHGIATASLDPGVSPNDELQVAVRGQARPAARTRLPFYRRSAMKHSHA